MPLGGAPLCRYQHHQRHHFENTNSRSGIKTHIYTCIYANISETVPQFSIRTPKLSRCEFHSLLDTQQTQFFFSEGP